MSGSEGYGGGRGCEGSSTNSSIVISLRNDMFELAHRLVGIYKTSNVSLIGIASMIMRIVLIAVHKIRRD